MKFRQLGQLALASVVSAALVVGVTACGQSNTIDFIYVTSASSNPGSIFAYASDGESGALTSIGKTFSSGGRNPVAIVTAPNNKFLYLINHDDNSLVEFAAGSDGVLYPQNTYNSKFGTSPTALTVSPDGKMLYVVDAYGVDASLNPYSPTTPGVGALLAYPINADGSLGTETAYATCNNPVAVAASGDGTAVYVVDNPAGQLPSLIETVAQQNIGATGSATVNYPVVGRCSGGANNPVGQISAYAVGSNGALTQNANSPYSAGVSPVGIAVDPTSRFAYVVDFRANQLLSYSVQPGGGLITQPNSPPTTDQLPTAITIDPRGKFIVVPSYSPGTVDLFAIDATTGAASRLAGSGSNTTQSGPVGVLVDPSIGRYIYTANYVDGSVSGLYLVANASTTNLAQNTPYTGAGKATAIAAVKHGDHAVQINPSY